MDFNFYLQEQLDILRQMIGRVGHEVLKLNTQPSSLLEDMNELHIKFLESKARKLKCTSTK